MVDNLPLQKIEGGCRRPADPRHCGARPAGVKPNSYPSIAAALAGKLNPFPRWRNGFCGWKGSLQLTAEPVVAV
jgi:hypothetical protein